MLKEIQIPSSVETISDFAFYYALNLSNVVIGDGVKHIGKRAFHYNYSLSEIYIPDSVETIGAGAFEPRAGALHHRQLLQHPRSH